MNFSSENIFDKDRRKVFSSHMLRKIFLEDWVMKLVALIITLALWFGVTGLRTTTKQRFQNIPLNIRVSNNVEITNSPATEVSIVISGDKRKIDQLNPRDLIATLDLTDIQAGERTVQILPENISLSIELPQGVKLEEVQPNKIGVKLENIEEREITVRAQTKGEVAEGFEITDQMPTITPQKIRVRGPASFIRTLEFVSTEEIDLTNRNADFTALQIPINVVNPRLTALDAAVDVVFHIGKKGIGRLFIVPIQTDNGPKRVRVILYGEPSEMEGLTPESLAVELTKNDAGEIVPKVILPPELEGRIKIKEKKIIP